MHLKLTHELEFSLRDMQCQSVIINVHVQSCARVIGYCYGHEVISKLIHPSSHTPPFPSPPFLIFAVFEFQWPITTQFKRLCRFLLLIFAVFLPQCLIVFHCNFSPTLHGFRGITDTMYVKGEIATRA